MNNYTPPLANQSNASLKGGYTAPVSPYNALVKTTTDTVVLKGKYTAPQSRYHVVLEGVTGGGSNIFFAGSSFSQFGNATIFNTAQAIAPISYDGFSAGIPEIFNTAQAIVFSGFDSFAIDYTIRGFNTRMRVIKTDPLLQTVTCFGSDQISIGFPTIRNQRHYIRPDGNSDMYRQGIPKWILN